MSRFAALALPVHHRVAGMFLALACFGKQTVNVMSVGGGQGVLDVPDFLEHHIAGRLNGLDVSRFAHK